MKLLNLFEELSNDIKKAYEESVTVEDAEKLAAKFLEAQILVINELRIVDLDFRMKKSGTKAIRAAVLMEAASKGDKKPADSILQATVDLSDMVQSSQKGSDEAEVERDMLNNYLGVFKDAHIYFRTISKGGF